MNGGLSVQNSSRRNLVFKVIRAAGHSYLIKQGISADTNETIRREASAYLELKTGQESCANPAENLWLRSADATY